MDRGVVLFHQHEGDKLTEAYNELLGIGTRLAKDLDGPLISVVSGHGIGEKDKKTLCRGVDRALVLEHPELENYDPDLYGAVLEDICRELSAAILVFNHDRIGADLAPRLTVRLKACVTLDCIDLAIDAQTKRLVATKPIYGGSVLALYSSHHEPHIATIRDKVFAPLDPGEERSCEIEVRHPRLDGSLRRVEVLATVREELMGPKLEEADVIICGGRGIGSSEAFADLEDLAAALGGALAGTRPACEKGWIHSRRQIGLTGAKVTPKIYIGIGVSGAIQHMAGIVGAKVIVAINKDPDANIFREADIGAVGDFKEILPSLMRQLKTSAT